MDLLRSIFIWFEGIFVLVVFFPVTFLLWLLALPFDRKRKIIHRLLVWQSMLLVKIIPAWKVKLEGREKADRNTTYVIISNHLSIIDILIVNSLGLNFRWVSKIENMSVPVLGWYLRMAGYLTVDRGDDQSKAEMLARAYISLKEGTSVMLFPEGTRSVDNMPGFFKYGAFQLAMSAGVPVLPLVIDGTADVLPKHGRIIKGFHNIRLKVLDPVCPENFRTENPEELAKFFREMIAGELDIMRKTR